MNIRRAMILIGLLLALAVGGFAGARIADMVRPPAEIVADTIFYPTIPDGLEQELARLRSEQRSLGERLRGLTIMPPASGDGPVRVYDEPIPIDTAVAHARIDEGRLSTWLQVPDSNKARLVQLPTKDVRGCQRLDIAGNGMVRCQKPVFGVLDVVAEGAIGVSTSSVELDDRIGLGWRRTTASSTSINVYVRPSEFVKDQETHIYVGASIRKNLFGN